MLYLEFFGQNGTCICWVLEWNLKPSTMVFGTNFVLKTIGLNICWPILIQWYEYTSGYTTKLQQPGYYDFSTLSQVIQNTYTGKPLVGISPVGMELMFSEICPESMFDSNVTEKNLIWLAGLRKTQNHVR